MIFYGRHLNHIKLVMLSSLMLCSSCTGGTGRPVAQNRVLHHERSIQWFNRQAPGKTKGVALVIHGLNLHPDKMEPIISLLTRSGFDWYAICYAPQLLSFFPRLVVPSVSSRSYLSNYGTPIAAYMSLFDTLKHFKNHISPKLNVPTVVFIDKEDELVSFHGIERMVKTVGLDQWRFHFIKKAEQGVKVRMHHLIIDEPAVGKETWSEMKHVISKHLLL